MGNTFVIFISSPILFSFITENRLTNYKCREIAFVNKGKHCETNLRMGNFASCSYSFANLLFEANASLILFYQMKNDR
jgi:hypothetical protein